MAQDEPKAREHDDNHNYGGRLAESQERRVASAAQRDNARTKRQTNRDYEKCPRGSLATD